MLKIDLEPTYVRKILFEQEASAWGAIYCSLIPSFDRCIDLIEILDARELSFEMSSNWQNMYFEK